MGREAQINRQVVLGHALYQRCKVIFKGLHLNSRERSGQGCLRWLFLEIFERAFYQRKQNS